MADRRPYLLPLTRDLELDREDMQSCMNLLLTLQGRRRRQELLKSKS